MAAGDSDDAVCCVENTVEDRIMDSSASFHATYCKEELKRFKLRSGKVRLADDKTLDIAGIGDVVLKTSFGTSWTLKDVRYIPGLIRRLISVRQLDEEGYHVGFGDQQWWVTKGSLVVARRNKHGSLYMVEKAMALHLLHRSKDPATMILLSKTAAGVVVGLCILEEEWRGNDTSLAHLKVFDCDSFVKVKDVCGEAMKCTFIGNSSDEMRYSFRDTKSHQVIRSRDITFKDSIYGSRSATDSNSLMKPIQKSQVVLVDIIENLAENDSIVAEHGLSSEITQSPSESSDTSEGSENSRSFKDSRRFDEEYSKDGASSKEGGSETPQVRRSTRESKAPVRHSPSTNYLLLTENGEPVLFRSLELPAGKKASKSLWMFKVKEDQNGKKRYKARLEPSYVGALNDTSTQHKSEGFQLARQEENLECRLKEKLYRLIQALRLRYLNLTVLCKRIRCELRAMNQYCYSKKMVHPALDNYKRIDALRKHVLGYVLTVGVTKIEWESRLQKSITIYTKSLIHLAKNLKVGDEREVKVLRSFNWHPSELITEDGVLPERVYSQFNDVSSGYLDKHQFEIFTTASNESLDKAFDGFQKLISQMEVHGATVSKEDINQKFLRSLPPSWRQIALIMRNKPDIDQVDINDLYNNLRVYEDEMKMSSSSTLNSQNLAFLSSENTSGTNEVSTASRNFGVNTAGGTSSSNKVSSTPSADEVVCSFFAHQATNPPLDNEDLQQIDQDDLEELDIRQQVAMLTVRVQRFVKKTGRNLDFKGKQSVTFYKSKVECYNCQKKGH
ncbi:retrovirus-related pol polyprotein from transposon TNT 1-94, partial [Tanacetum coccineum]